jgi:hypothetical protein
MRVFLFLGLCAGAWALLHIHFDKNGYRECDLFDIIKEHGRISALKVGYWLTLGIMSWIMVDLQMDDHMEVGYFTVYGSVCAAPILAKMFAKNGATVSEVKP